MPLPNKILVVEDENNLAENLKTFLSRHTPEVLIASDARQTIDILKSFTPDVVVLDYALPDVDGLSIYTEIIHRQVPQAGCIMITGYPIENIDLAAKQRGIQYVLGKPFSFKELQHLVDICTDDAISLPLISATEIDKVKWQNHIHQYQI